MEIGFIGLGLIGGSLAKSIRRHHPDYRIYAYSHTPATLETALAEGIIDLALTENDERFATCDFIFLCAPVQINMTYLPFLKQIIKEDCIVSDVGSVKGMMMTAAKEAGLESQFIGGHPMAGSEKTGIANASDFLLENAYYFLTVSEQTPQALVDGYVELVHSIRSIPMVLSGEQHDLVVAGISHLPHIIASSLVNLVKDLDSPDEKMRQAAAGGFRDITRIASSSPVMWEQICMTNDRQIDKVLSYYIDYLDNVRSHIRSGDGAYINDMFTQSKNYRDSLNDSFNGSISRQYTLYVDIYDEPGGIATITTLLAMQQISIKNIGIMHNREFEDGILRIEFYDEPTLAQANKILTNRNYTIRKTS